MGKRSVYCEHSCINTRFLQYIRLMNSFPSFHSIVLNIASRMHFLISFSNFFSTYLPFLCVITFYTFARGMLQKGAVEFVMRSFTGLCNPGLASRTCHCVEVTTTLRGRYAVIGRKNAYFRPHLVQVAPAYTKLWIFLYCVPISNLVHIMKKFLYRLRLF